MSWQTPWPTFVAEPVFPTPLVVEGFWCWRCSNDTVKVWHGGPYCPLAPVAVTCPTCGHEHECAV